MHSLQLAQGRYRAFPRNRISSAIIETLERRQLFAAPVVFNDTDGDQVTIRLSGAGTLAMDPATRNVATADTKVSSVLSISVRRAHGGDGLVTLGELRCYGPMRAINGPQADITTEISIDDRMVPVAKSSKVSLNLGALKDLAVYTGGQRIGTIKLADWSLASAGQELNAPTVDSLIITGRKDVAGTATDESLPGNCSALLILGDSSTTASDWSVRNIHVPGILGDIQATGRVGNIVAGQITGQLLASSFGTISTHAVRNSSVATGTISGSITAAGAPGVHTSLGRLSAGSDVTNLTLATETGDIGQITVAGQMLNSSVTSPGDIQGVDLTLGLFASRIQSQGNVGHIRVGSISESEIEVGVAPTFGGLATTSADFANPSARLANFSIVGVKGLAATDPLAFATNTLSAARLGTLNLRNVDSAAAMQIYVLDSGSPGSVHYADAGNHTTNFSWHHGQPEPDVLSAMLHQA